MQKYPIIGRVWYEEKTRAAVKYTPVINEYYKGFESYYFPEQQQNDRNSDSSRTTGWKV